MAAPAPPTCEATPGSAVPDCPVEPADIGRIGTLNESSWRLVQERHESVPTATDARVDAITRHYESRGTKEVVYTVITFGDITPVNEATMEAIGYQREPGLREGFDIFVGVEGLDYQWGVEPRVLAQVSADPDDAGASAVRQAVEEVRLTR